MKTLYQRLKPEFKSQLRNAISSYPLTYMMVNDELHAKNNVFDMSFAAVNDLSRATNTIEITQVFHLFEDQE